MRFEVINYISFILNTSILFEVKIFKPNKNFDNKF